MEESFKELSKKIITKEDLVFLLGEINLVQKSVFKDIDIPLSERVQENISEDFKQFIKKLEEEKIILKNPQENQTFFDNLKKYLQSLPQIKIEVAFPPEKKFIDKVFLWLKKEFNQKLILDLVFNPKIIGGAVIEYKGKRINLSLAKKIDELENQI